MSSSSNDSVPRTRWAVVALVSAIACLDMVTGLRLMFSGTPWLQNSHETLWMNIPAEARSNPAVLALFHALYGRIGAFSFHAGVITLIWALWGRTSRYRIRALLVTYSLTGGAFFWFDRAYFEGTPYFMMKTVISWLWTAALVAHFAFDRPAKLQVSAALDA